jgi:hypothetical protein
VESIEDYDLTIQYNAAGRMWLWMLLVASVDGLVADFERMSISYCFVGVAHKGNIIHH